MCLAEAKSEDHEERNRRALYFSLYHDVLNGIHRTRLVGLSALTGAVTSSALYNSSAEFKTQVAIITPALLLTIQQAELSVLNDEFVISHFSD